MYLDTKILPCFQLCSIRSVCVTKLFFLALRPALFPKLLTPMAISGQALKVALQAGGGVVDEWQELGEPNPGLGRTRILSIVGRFICVVWTYCSCADTLALERHHV